MTESSGYGTSHSSGDTHTLRYRLSLPHPVEKVWAAIATKEGLPGWLAAADVLEPRRGGAVTLRWLNTDATDGNGAQTIATGTLTVWEPPQVVEYTVTVHGRFRFHLEHEGPDETILRFANKMTGPDEERLSCLAGWHQHFEFLADALDGRPKDWSTWSLDHWRELKDTYARLEPRSG